MTKVVGLHGRKPPGPDGADPNVIEYIEQLLDMARSGGIVAFGALVVSHDGHVFTHHCGRGHKHTLVACCEYLKYDLCAEP